MAFEAVKTAFFHSPAYAVVGASKDQTKYGTKVLQWYKTREMDVTPVHPKESELEGITAVKSIEELSSPSTTSISIVTPSKITLALLQKAKELNVPALWIQPGASDRDCIQFIKDNDMVDKVIYGGSCVLTEGDNFRTNH
ncbi:CoA-binding protein [Lentinula aff. lateritia]|uniref:CoA-binding protein n=1 Tax=Lentinula aff. lateritia TaxID=2804960 RepID=A0ACC1U312_9AGAR|nr:CoA-binding protein [Lentinula aff. lateritia]